jgi:hypothetical protein
VARFRVTSARNKRQPDEEQSFPDLRQKSRICGAQLIRPPDRLVRARGQCLVWQSIFFFTRRPPAEHFGNRSRTVTEPTVPIVQSWNGC